MAIVTMVKFENVEESIVSSTLEPKELLNATIQIFIDNTMAIEMIFRTT